MSFQSKMIEVFMRLRARFMDQSGTLDMDRDRADTEALADMFKPLAPARHVPVTADGVPAEWAIPPQEQAGRVILHLHGGSFFAGSIASHRPLVANLAFACQARVLLIDYRLAPEHPFPAGLEDTRKSYDWLLAQGYQPGQIIIAGDSAGGALAAGLLVQLRDEGKPMPAAAVLLSPLLDLTLSGESWISNAKKDVMIDVRKERTAVEYYLKGVSPRDPLASPLFADLRGLPPILIQVGSQEVLVSDCTSFVEKAKAAGAEATVEIWPGMQHEWQFAAKILPEGKQAVLRIGEFVERVAFR